jgi:hypothetical protein
MLVTQPIRRPDPDLSGPTGALSAPSAPPPLARPAPRLYFVNGWVDAAMIGGVSIIVFALLHIFLGDETQPRLLYVVAALSIFANYPHFSATLYRLYQSPQNIRQFPVTALGVPLLLVAAVSASLWQPDWVAPYFVMLFLVWSPFHYSGQTIGLTLLYTRRSGLDIGRWHRMALSAFVYGTFIVSFTHPRNDAPTLRYGVSIPMIHFPAWFDAIIMTVMCVSAAVLLHLLYVWYRTHKRVPPAIILLPAVAQFVWFLPGKQTAAFFEFVPLFHSVQYLYIAWAMQLGLRLTAPDAAAAPRSLVQESLRWALRNYIGGMLLFIALPWMLFWVKLPLVTSAGIVTAAVNIHHFFVDGVIWKLRNTTQASPLTMSMTDWASPRVVAA